HDDHERERSPVDDLRVVDKLVQKHGVEVTSLGRASHLSTVDRDTSRPTVNRDSAAPRCAGRCAAPCQTPSVAWVEQNLTAGAVIGSYRIEALIGRGGMGAVYLAEHVHLRRRVALKVLPPGLADDPAFRERFIRESQLSASIDHPNIIPVHDADDE